MQEKSTLNGVKFIVFSLFGIFMFFVSIDIGGKSTIPLDHIVSWIQSIPHYFKIYGLTLVTIGALFPFIKGIWNKDLTTTIFSLCKLFGIICVVMVVFNIGPGGLLAGDMLPFIFSKIVVPVTTIIPVGSVFLAFITGYGLMEFIGVFMRPIMMPIWKTPGRSAIDAVASFVGSYSIALLITNRVYTEGKYTDKEAAIIATGFSTVSAAFMIIVATTLGIMDYWLKYFWFTVIVTFLVTAITARIYPLSKKKDRYYNDAEGDIEQDVSGNRFKIAWDAAMDTCSNAPGLLENVAMNFKDGFSLAINVAPTLMGIGAIGLILANYTPLFDIIGYIFYPVTLLLRIPESLLAAKAVAVSIAEMLLPAVVVANSPLTTRFIIAIVSVSEILFFSASIPCMMATEIPLTMLDYIIIWIERVILSLIIAAPLVYLFV
ncbi:YjiH family protein [Tissierella simiarum]|nr:YjiH family protein [Tissierella simiarum]